MKDRTGRAPQQQQRKRNAAALVIAGTMLCWLGIQWLGPKIGLHGNYALLFDFAALAALFWALLVIVEIWRQNQKK